MLQRVGPCPVSADVASERGMGKPPREETLFERARRCTQTASLYLAPVLPNQVPAILSSDWICAFLLTNS
eukprot:COSAG04_NODE_837_length_9971_cov_6.099271_9_plen_70_part_00